MYNTTSGGGGAAFAWAFVIIGLVIGLLVIIAVWQVYTKAGKPGWACLIPFYNVYVLLEIVGRPGWWLVLYFIPVIDVFVWIIVVWELAKSFGKSGGFAIGLLFLPFIFYPILGFGSARYLGPAALGPVGQPPASQPPPTWTQPAVPPPPPPPGGSSG
jgi:hypothetical protein